MFKELRQRYFNFNLKSGLSESQLYSLNRHKVACGFRQQKKKVNWQIYLFETHETVEQEDDSS